ncbi:MAG TPA: DUF4249 domain-containing protein [Mucilaginibacter sp.]|jgi:uncharacterized lipoprotein YajG
MMQNYFRYVVFFAIVVVTGCKKPYDPTVVSSPNSYLVVEGVINSGSDSTIIKLSRTVKLSDKVTSSRVLGALVTVESDQNSSFPLTEIENGDYISPGLNLDNTRKYRLRIKTSNEEYLSDFVAVVNSPSIDSINYTVGSNGVNIYTNTHDPKNNTHYYRWDYQETYIFHSNYYSLYKSNGDTVLLRDMVNDEIYRCWRSDTSSTIILGSSAKLKNDVIVNNPLTSVASTSEKFTEKYSINVRQYALTGDAYAFWQNLKKNTEQLGSIFDALPSNINGNIHSTTNPLEPVIGYISVGSVASQRIFISSNQLPLSFFPTRTDQCQLDSFYFVFHPPNNGPPINQENIYFNYNKGATDPEIPVDAIVNAAGKILGHSGADIECVDCTLRGTNKQPAFWK